MEDQIDTEAANKVYQSTKGKNEEEKYKMWKDLKCKLKAGAPLTGKIFYKAAYGVYLDVGLSFPAILRIVDMVELDYSEFVKDTTYKLGQEVDLTYIWMSDKPDKIDVHERK